MTTNAYSEMLKQWDNLLTEQARTGWESPEVKAASEQVRRVLWACANNPVPAAAFITMLREAMARLDRARGGSPPTNQ